MSSFIVINCDECGTGVSVAVSGMAVRVSDAEQQLVDRDNWKLDVVTGELVCPDCQSTTEEEK